MTDAGNSPSFAQLLMNMCKHFIQRFSSNEIVFLHTFAQLSDYFPLYRKFDAYLHILLKYNDSYYFCKVTLSNDERLDASDSFAHDQKQCIHRALYSVMHLFALILSCVKLFSFVIFYLSIKFAQSTLIHPVKCISLRFPFT